MDDEKLRKDDESQKMMKKKSDDDRVVGVVWRSCDDEKSQMRRRMVEVGVGNCCPGNAVEDRMVSEMNSGFLQKMRSGDDGRVLL